MKNKSIMHYVFGLLTGLLFIPIIEESISVIQTWIQVLLIKPSKIVVKGNKELSEMQSEEEYTETHCIGFHVDDDEYYDDDYYEE